MSQPPAYSRSFSFTNFQAGNPTTALPGSQVDLELNNAKATLDAVLANIKLIQRDDGGVRNATIGLDQLKAEVPVGFNAPVVWVTAAPYTAGSSTVFNGSGFYRCLVTHTSGVFATDLAALKWQLIVNLAAVPLVNASQIAVTPSGSLTSNAQTSLQALDAGKAPTSHTHPASAISDSTAPGRALLTAPDVATQNSLLGISLLGFQTGDVKETAVIVLPSGWYYCDGSAKSRVTDAALFNAITIQQTGVVTSGSAVITGLADTSNMSTMMPISGFGIQLTTRIATVDSASQITMGLPATASSTTGIAVAPYGAGDGFTTFNLPNRAYIGIGRDNASGSASNVSQVSTNISLTSGSATATVAGAASLAIGMYITHPKVPIGNIITAISGTTVTMSAAATATVSSTGRFSMVFDAQSLGAVGGALSYANTLVTANLPAYTPAGTITNGAITISGTASNNTGTANGVIQAGGLVGNYTAASLSASQAASTLAGAAQGGTSLPFRTGAVAPTIVMNYIIKR